MAALGSDVQSTSVELVSIIETMREQRSELDREMQKEKEEQRHIQNEMRKLEERLAEISETLARKEAKIQHLDRTIEDTFTAFKNILEASRKLLSNVKQESSRHQTSSGVM